MIRRPPVRPLKRSLVCVYVRARPRLSDACVRIGDGGEGVVSVSAFRGLKSRETKRRRRRRQTAERASVVSLMAAATAKRSLPSISTTSREKIM